MGTERKVLDENTVMEARDGWQYGGEARPQLVASVLMLCVEGAEENNQGVQRFILQHEKQPRAGMKLQGSRKEVAFDVPLLSLWLGLDLVLVILGI